MAYKLNWGVYTKTEDNPVEPSIDFIKAQFEIDKPQIIVFDTETTGLNIVKDTPFLLVISWKVFQQNLGKCFVIEWDKDKMKDIYSLFARCKFIIGQNTKYDLHMFRMGGAPFPFEILNENCNLTDTRILRRITATTDMNKNQDKMALKQMATEFIDVNASKHDRIVSDLIRKKNVVNSAILQSQLKVFNYKVAQIKAIVKDCRRGIESLPENVQTIYNNWSQEYGEVTYKDIFISNPFEMITYASYDGIYTLELFLLFHEEYLNLNMKSGNTLSTVFRQENSLIKLYYKQEIIGIKVDMEYLKKAKLDLSKYLLLLEKESHSQLGVSLSENQHTPLRELFKTKFNVPDHVFVDSKTGKEGFDKSVIKTIIGLNTIASGPAKLIAKLRGCRKWASTYVDGIYKKVLENGDGKLHPSSDQVGTVSGRITGNMQQVPKDPMYDLDGNEIFHPRKIFLPSGGDYEFLVMQDFDQMELRIQAHYTIQYGCTDVNLSKIFVPLNCYHYQTKETYDIDKYKYNWGDKQLNGDSIWLDDKTHKPWLPIDPHGMHVVSAFGLTPDHPDWKNLRNCAKTINFAINYGSGLNGLLNNVNLEEYSSETITKIFNAYKDNFSGVKRYQVIVNNHVKNNLSIPNQYGRLYRVSNSNSAYKCGSYVVQGSCADVVKQCLLKIDELFQTYKAKSRVLYTIHDEVMWELHKDEGFLIEMVKEILNTTASWSKIPLTCGTDLTHTNWAEKQDIKNYIGDK